MDRLMYDKIIRVLENIEKHLDKIDKKLDKDEQNNLRPVVNRPSVRDRIRIR
ncbi:hypothetical protein [Clostridium sp. JS66]|uniref:hypothetical protein n=1 Tax=Clostridium sp. JS66 TaxID=3064705 RepID=UPI00298DE1E3|nr:hypothetical protein [Clostridium sp. JS66]WPC42940.1 hypothetical protein Q6H37_05565 [Clostridium sp. JS66]